MITNLQNENTECSVPFSVSSFERIGTSERPRDIALSATHINGTNNVSWSTRTDATQDVVMLGLNKREYNEYVGNFLSVRIGQVVSLIP